MIAKTVIVSESVLCNVPNNKMYVKYEITNFETVFSVNNKIKKNNSSPKHQPQHP